MLNCSGSFWVRYFFDPSLEVTKRWPFCTVELVVLSFFQHDQGHGCHGDGGDLPTDISCSRIASSSSSASCWYSYISYIMLESYSYIYCKNCYRLLGDMKKRSKWSNASGALKRFYERQLIVSWPSWPYLESMIVYCNYFFSTIYWTRDD